MPARSVGRQTGTRDGNLDAMRQGGGGCVLELDVRNEVLVGVGGCRWASHGENHGSSAVRKTSQGEIRKEESRAAGMDDG